MKDLEVFGSAMFITQFSIFITHYSKFVNPTNDFLIYLNFYSQFSSLNTQKSENEWWDIKSSFMSFQILENWVKRQNSNNTHKIGPTCDELFYHVRWYLFLKTRVLYQGPYQLSYTLLFTNQKQRNYQVSNKNWSWVQELWVMRMSLWIVSYKNWDMNYEIWVRCEPIRIVLWIKLKWHWVQY